MLKQRLVEIIPRESSGPRSANRFDYQHDWALCKLLELHRAGSDYVIVFDYHDDVLVLDSASDPKAVIFYQVKTKQSGTWKRSDLIKQQKGKAGKLPSILGKLYSNYDNFPDETTGLQFISNAYFELKLHEGGTGVGRQTIRFVDLDNDERSKLGNSLQNELGKSPSPNGVNLFVYQTSDLSLQGHVEHALGKLTSFLDRLPDTTTAGAAAFYRTLKGLDNETHHGGRSFRNVR